ncbi:MAG: hypothetical protein ACI9R3_002637 [Verrucomicrobiales bacterium]|jgi:hypothetical protein
MTARIGRSLAYFFTLLLGALLGFLFAMSDHASKPTSPEFRNESSGATLLSSSSKKNASKRRFEDAADQSVNAYLSVPVSVLKNLGFSGCDVHDGKLLIDDALTRILSITDGEAAEMSNHFSSILSRVRELQLQSTEVVSHDPDGETVMKVAASSEAQSQLWLDEVRDVCKEVLGDVRGDQFREIISGELNNSLAYSAMTITAKASSTSDVPREGFFEFIIESEGGTETYNSKSAPTKIAHLIGLSEPSDR